MRTLNLFLVKNSLIGFLLISLFFGTLSSCTDNDYDVPGVDNGNPRELVLNYQLLSTTDVVTRATATDEEMDINDLYILFFNHATDVADRTYISCTRYEVDNKVEDGTVTIPLPEGISGNDKFFLYFVANMEAYVNKGSYTDHAAWLKATLTNKTYAEASKLIVANKIITSNELTSPLPMYGSYEKNNSSNNITAKLSRNVSRIDLSVDENKVSNFELKSAAVWNARANTVILTGEATGTSYIHCADKKEITDVVDNAIVGSLYAFPNKQTVTTKGDGVTTCLIVGGEYDGSGEVTYYRVNVKPQIGSQNLKANYRYLINITKVTGAGAKTPEEAYKGSDGLLNYTINDWEDDEMGMYVYDEKGNGLAVSPNKVTFGYNQGLEGKVNILKKIAEGNSNPSATIKENSDPTNFSVTLDNDAGTLTVKTLTDNYGIDDRTAYVVIEWNGIEVPVYITQVGATSTAGGMRVVPGSVRFDKNAGTEVATITITGDLGNITDVENALQYQILNVSNDLSTPWCTIEPVGGKNFQATGVPGVYKFTVKVDAMADAADYARSSMVHLALTKSNGETLNTSLAVYQSAISSSSDDRVVAYYMRWKDATKDPNTTAATSTTGYTEPVVWGLAASAGFPEDQVGARHLHFSEVPKLGVKYRLEFKTTMSWRIIARGEAISCLNFSATTSQACDITVNDRPVVYITAVYENISAMVDGSFVVQYSDGKEDEFFVYQKGVVGPVGEHYGTGIDSKHYYYGVDAFMGLYWLDRNLGATSNSWYSNAATSKGDANAKGLYFTSTTQASNACPPGFRLPTKAEMETLLKEVVAWDNTKKLYYNFVSSEIPEQKAWYLPLSGSGSTPTNANGLYWFQGGNVYIAADGGLTWNSYTSTTSGLSARCVRKVGS